jgi:hypothetical protein
VTLQIAKERQRIVVEVPHRAPPKLGLPGTVP